MAASWTLGQARIETETKITPIKELEDTKAYVRLRTMLGIFALATLRVFLYSLVQLRCSVAERYRILPTELEKGGTKLQTHAKIYNELLQVVCCCSEMSDPGKTKTSHVGVESCLVEQLVPAP